jgi:hypothetical protein
MDASLRDQKQAIITSGNFRQFPGRTRIHMRHSSRYQHLNTPDDAHSAADDAHSAADDAKFPSSRSLIAQCTSDLDYRTAFCHYLSACHIFEKIDGGKRAISDPTTDQAHHVITSGDYHLADLFPDKSSETKAESHRGPWHMLRPVRWLTLYMRGSSSALEVSVASHLAGKTSSVFATKLQPVFAAMPQQDHMTNTAAAATNTTTSPSLYAEYARLVVHLRFVAKYAANAEHGYFLGGGKCTLERRP